MRKRTWLKTAGVAAFATQLLGGAGLARATDNACFPMPTFVAGGNPDPSKMDHDNATRWTGSSGYSWNSGALSELSYEAAVGVQPVVTGHPEIGPKRLLVSLLRQVPLAQVLGSEGLRIGFNYNWTDPHDSSTHVLSQILSLTFDDGGHTPAWNKTPAACPPAVAGGNCANDDASDPTMWQPLSPKQVYLYQKKDDGAPQLWPTDSSVATDWTAWVKANTYIFLFSHKDPLSPSSPPTYYWRINMALPTRGGPAPAPTDFWSSPSIYMDANAFVQSASKPTPPFWIDMVTNPINAAMITTYHFPNWDDTAHVGARDPGTQIPTTTLWGTAEVGSPRDPALLDAGDIPCSGSGIIIPGTVGDNVVWHSSIWNTSAGSNSAGLFDDGGQLYLFDVKHFPTNPPTMANKLAVQIQNTSSTPVDKSKINAQFLIAPYGSQAAKTIWTPLNDGGNDFTCTAGDPAGSCRIQPKPGNTLNSASTTTGNLTNTPGDAAELDMTPWTPSTNYACAVQTTDTAPYDWFYDNYGLKTGRCASAVYQPNDTAGNATTPSQGLPAHSCIQVQLSGNNVQFATKSAFRNMHQGKASLHREVATIDTRGLPKVKNQSYHDIYLYVETRNMPYRVDNGYSPRTYNLAMQIYNRVNGGCIEGECGGPGFDPSVPAPSEDFFAKEMPTFVVNAYADTGVRFKSAGTTYPVLQPMTSFGQFISHDSTVEGAVYGWDANLEPVNGTTFTKIAENTYRIRIPNDGAGKVITHVEPLPSKRPTCSGTVDMNIVELLQSIAPLITVDNEDAGEINALIDSLQIQCVDLQWLLNKIVGGNWGPWTSWVKFLVTEVEAASGCKCN